MLRSPETKLSLYDLPEEYIKSPSIRTSTKKLKKACKTNKINMKTPKKKKVEEKATDVSTFNAEEFPGLKTQEFNTCNAIFSAAPLRYTNSIEAAHYYDPSESAPHPTWINSGKSSFTDEILSLNKSGILMHEISSEEMELNKELSNLSALSAAALVMSKIESNPDLTRTSRSESGSTSTETVDSDLIRISRSESGSTSTETVDYLSDL